MSAPAYNPRDYPPVAVTVDLVVFTVVDAELRVLLVERGAEPYQGSWALPGGFIKPDEDLDESARRELVEETGIKMASGHIEQFGTYGAPDRDPRMRVVTVAYWAIVPDLPQPKGGSDAAAAMTVPVDDVLAHPKRLAFDHHAIVTDGLERARQALETTTAAVAFCPPEFTISQLRRVYEAVWGTTLDPGNFQHRVTDTAGFVEPTGKTHQGARGRPAELYRAGGASELDPPLRRPKS